MKRINTKNRPATQILPLMMLLAVCLMLTGCAELFQSKIAMDVTSSSMSLREFFQDKAVISKLEPPKQVFVSQGVFSDRIQLIWDDVDGATSYQVERAVVQSGSAYPEEEEFSLVADYVVSSSYVDKIIQNPGPANPEYAYSYYYRIRSENRFMGYEPSDATEYRTAASRGYLFRPASSVVADKGKSTDHITVTWESVPEAVGYDIYRGNTDTDMNMFKVAHVRSSQNAANPAALNRWTNEISSQEQGNEYYYQVCAVNADGQESARSVRAMGYTLKEGAPPAPEVTVTGGLGTSTSQLSISWSAVSVPDGYGACYSVYRTSSADSGFTLVAKNVTGTTYTDSSSSLKKNLKYYYYVQATTWKTDEPDNLLKGPFSESGPEAASPAVNFLLSPPADIEVNDVPDNAARKTIRFKPAVGYDCAGVTFAYTLFAADADDPLAYQAVSGAENVAPAPAADGWYEIEVDKRNFYRLMTVNAGAGNLESPLSQAAAPIPQAPRDVKASRTASVSGEANTAGVYPVYVTWQAPEGEDPAGYYVYRSTKPDSGFRKLSEEPVTAAGGNGTFSFIDANETAKPGVLYYYKVISLNSLGQGKNGNVPVYGYGALTREQWFREYNRTTMNSQKKLTLMHKSGNTAKLGSESTTGDISGTLSYNAAISGLSGAVTMHYENYADFYIDKDNVSLGVYFNLTGNTDTSAGTDTNGTMSGNVVCTGMYPGIACYDKIEIKGGAAGGGTYGVTTKDLEGNVLFEKDEISWRIGEEK